MGRPIDLTKKIKKPCEWCGREFLSYRIKLSRFCSKPCSCAAGNAHRKKTREQRECPVCHNLFEVTTVRTKHCSNKCRYIGHRKAESEKFKYIPKPPKVANCEVCGIEVVYKGKKVKYCPSCRVAHAAQHAHKYSQTEEYKEAHRRRARIWQLSNPEKSKVQSLTKSHPERLNIIYECPCVSAGKHHHHPDYSKTYDVVLLCDGCHAKEHVRLRSLLAIPGPMAANQ